METDGEANSTSFRNRTTTRHEQHNPMVENVVEHEVGPTGASQQVSRMKLTNEFFKQIIRSHF